MKSWTGIVIVMIRVTIILSFSSGMSEIIFDGQNKNHSII